MRYNTCERRCLRGLCFRYPDVSEHMLRASAPMVVMTHQAAIAASGIHQPER